MKDCDLKDTRGRCRKSATYCSCSKCESRPEWFDDELFVCEVDEVCRRGSIFGNAYFRITEEQIEALRDGKVLYELSEYGTFIMLVKEK